MKQSLIPQSGIELLPNILSVNECNAMLNDPAECVYMNNEKRQLILDKEENCHHNFTVNHFQIVRVYQDCGLFILRKQTVFIVSLVQFYIRLL